MPLPVLRRIFPWTKRGLRNGIALSYLPVEDDGVLPRVGVIPFPDPPEHESHPSIEAQRALVPRAHLEEDPGCPRARRAADALGQERPADPPPPPFGVHGDVQQVGLSRDGPADGVPEDLSAAPRRDQGVGEVAREVLDEHPPDPEGQPETSATSGAAPTPR